MRCRAIDISGIEMRAGVQRTSGRGGGGLVILEKFTHATCIYCINSAPCLSSTIILTFFSRVLHSCFFAVFQVSVRFRLPLPTSRIKPSERSPCDEICCLQLWGQGFLFVQYFHRHIVHNRPHRRESTTPRRSTAGFSGQSRRHVGVGRGGRRGRGGGGAIGWGGFYEC